MNEKLLRVRYLELTQLPPPAPSPPGDERIAAEKLAVDEYLELYRRVGEPLRWDQRLKMPRSELTRLLLSDHSRIYVLRSSGNEPLGLCEFEHHVPDIELKNFGLVPAAQGRRLGPWLLGTALEREWALGARRIWLHTDDWDHPAALPLYERAGFRLFDVRDEPPGDL